MTKGEEAYERLQRRFQPRLGKDSRSAFYLRERTFRLIAWYEEKGFQVWKLKARTQKSLNVERGLVF